MDLKNCSECGRVFADDGVHDLCERCRDSEKEKYKKVKEFLWDNPNSSVNKVHQETGVEKELIIKFVKDGRLISDGLNLDYQVHCERCGKTIESGKYCEQCKQILVDGFHSGKNKKKKSKKKKKDSSKEMYIKDRINRHKGNN